MKKTILIVIFGIIAVGLGWLALLAVCIYPLFYWPLSETKDLVKIESPDHQYVAAAYHVIGGATVADSTIVVLYTKGRNPFDRTNGAVLIADNLAPFQISWAQNRLLTVKCSMDRTYSKKTSWRDVSVQYIGE